MRSLLVAILALASLCVSSITLAQAPDSLSFQGYVTDPGGVPVNNPGESMIFKLYEGSSEVWSEIQPSVKIEGGVFNVRLGSVTPLDTVRFNRPLSLGIKVGTDPEISPRTPLTAAAYAKAMPGMYTFYREDAVVSSYNVVGGAANNVVDAGVVGATIGGGGGIFDRSPVPNRVGGDFATVGGGTANTASDWYATVGGGTASTASDDYATVGGGQSNTASGINATVGGGVSNTASGGQATVGGGQVNTASATDATVGGGQLNTASGVEATVGGGELNTASASGATVPGGFSNRAAGYDSFAAGFKAKAIHEGTFVWSDRSIITGDDSLVSTGSNQFLIRAAGGVGIGTDSPAAALHVVGRVQIGSAEYLEDLGAYQLATNANFLPTGNGVRSLGTVTHRWSEVHAVNGVIQTSDRRLKRNIQPLSAGLGTVMQLRPVSFNWIDGAETGTQFGLVAQDVLEVIPEAVNVSEVQIDEETGTRVEAPAAYMGINYSRVIPFLIKAIQDQQATIETLSARVQALEAN